VDYGDSLLEFSQQRRFPRALPLISLTVRAGSRGAGSCV
jgi:hypothetical protein